MRLLSPVPVLAALLLAAPLGADAIMVTRAMRAETIVEYFVGEEGVRVDLEIGLRDLNAFRNLMPDHIYEKLGHAPRPLQERLDALFRSDLVVRKEGGPPLPGAVVEIGPRPRVKRDEITGEPLPVAEGDEEIVVFATLLYPLEGRPEAVTVAPPPSIAGIAGAEIGFVLYHRGIAVNDFRYLGREETVRLDWDDPWYSKFDNRNLWRQYNSPVSAFLYVEPFEVRKEIVLRPRDLQHWTDLGLEGRETLPVTDQQAVKEKVAAFLAEQTPVTIDGVPSEGVLDRVHFIRRSLKTTRVIDPPEDLDLASATLGVIFVYPTTGLPQEATLEWRLFSDRIHRIPAAATDEAGGLPFFLVPEDPVLVWQNFLKNPTIPGLVEVKSPGRRGSALVTGMGLAAGAIFVVLAFVCILQLARGGRPQPAVLGGAAAAFLISALLLLPALRGPRLADEDAAEVVAGLLENVYRAFDHRNEEIIYDTLARSAAGDLLTEIYLDTRRSLELESQGGARVKVKEVAVMEADHEALDDGEGFSSTATWNVTGSVGHWGHIHQRTNQYQARLRVEPLEGAWKITGLELLREERL